MKTSIIVSVLALLVAGGTLFLYFGHSVPVPAGAAASPDVSFHTFFHDNATIGGNDFATSSAGTATYTASSFVNSNVIEHKATGALTVTLPTGAALSSAGFLPSIGDTQEMFIHASTTKITLAGNTGLTLSSASSTKDISPNTTALLSCVRLGATEGRLIQCLLIAD